MSSKSTSRASGRSIIFCNLYDRCQQNRFQWFKSGFPLSGLEALRPFAYPFKSAPALPDSA